MCRRLRIRIKYSYKLKSLILIVLILTVLLICAITALYDQPLKATQLVASLIKSVVASKNLPHLCNITYCE